MTETESSLLQSASLRLMCSLSLGVMLCKAVSRRGRVVDFVSVFRNLSFERITGFDDQLGLSYFERFPASKDTGEAQHILAAIQRVLKSGGSEVLESYSPSVGGWFCFEFIDVGVTNHFMMVINRISERIELDRLAHLGLAEQRFLLEGSNIGYWKSVDRVFVWTNDTFRKMLGYRKNELVGRSTRAIYRSQDEYEAIKPHVRRLNALGRELHLEMHLVKKDGSYGWFEIRMCQINEEGRFTLIGSCIDRSQKRTALLELKNSQSRLELALEASSAVFFDWDVANDQLEIAERFDQVLGFQLERTMKSFTSIVHRADRAVLQRFIDTCLSGEQAHGSCDFRVRHHDGHWVWLQLRGRVVEYGVDEQNIAIRMAGTITDVTANKRFEKDTEQLLGRLEDLIRNHVRAPQNGDAPSVHRPVHAALSRRQVEVLRLISRGDTSTTIAKKLNISVATVHAHRRELLRRLNQNNVAALTRFAIENGIV